MRGKLNSHHQEFVALWNDDDVRVREIAKRFGVTTAYVSQYAKKHRKECPKRYGREKANIKEKKSRVSRVNHDDFVKLWNADVTIRNMAKYFGVCKQYISKYAKKYELECPKRSRGGKCKFEDRRAIEMLNEGLSLREIGRRLGVSHICISAYLKRNCVGYEIKRAKVDFEEFKEMWNNGVDSKDIAERFGVTKHYIYTYATAHKGLGLDRKAGKHKSE